MGFMAFVARPLATVTLGNVQAFADSLTGKPSWRARTLAAVKSLLAFGQRTGYLPLNVGAGVKLPARKDTLAERILSEPDIVCMLALEPNRRNQVLLRLLHIAGLRVSEIAALSWRQLQPRTDGGQVTVFGKGDKTRVVLLPAAIWRELLCFRQGADLDAPLFPVPPRRWPPRSDGGAADRQEGGETRWPGGKCLAALTAPQPRHARARARRADPPGAGNPGPRLGGQHGAVPARAADRQFVEVFGSLRDSHGGRPLTQQALT